MSAAQRFSFRRWRIECECAGAPFVWEGEAVSEQAAIRCAAHDLAVRLPDVQADQVRATVCIELPACCTHDCNEGRNCGAQA